MLGLPWHGLLSSNEKLLRMWGFWKDLSLVRILRWPRVLSDLLLLRERYRSTP